MNASTPPARSKRARRLGARLASRLLLRPSIVIDGTLIGSYRVGRRLGAGGMGAVYRVEHTLLGRPAAIKVLLPRFSANEEIVARFFNEARATTSISDPGIVQIFDFGHHTDGSAYIVMELLEGESLDARLRRLGRLGLVDALRLTRQIAVSLQAAHAKGIVHRDLKPDNVFLVGDPGVTGGERPKILDFGIAKLAADEPGAAKTRTGSLLGTPLFMSPEQCRGAGDLDHRSDVYALGCMLFCMVTGGPPFTGEGMGDIIVAHIHEPPPPPSRRAEGVPLFVDDLVLRCLAKSPGDRYASMREVADALHAAEARLLGGAPPLAPVSAVMPTVMAPGMTAPALTATATPAPGTPRRRGRVAVIGASAIAAAVALFIAFGRGQPSEASDGAAAIDAGVDAEVPEVDERARAVDAAVAPAIAVELDAAAAPPPSAPRPPSVDASVTPPRGGTGTGSGTGSGPGTRKRKEDHDAGINRGD